MEKAAVSLDQQLNPVRYYFGISQIFKTLPLVILYNTLIAVFLTLTGVDQTFWIGFIMAQCYGIPIYILIAVAFRYFNPEAKLIRSIVICLIGSVCGYVVGSLQGPFFVERFLSTKLAIPLLSTRNIVFVLTFVGVASFVFYSISHFRVSAAVIQQERFNRLSSEKEALDAQLKLMQAQIEPHFLFNTLSNILSLIETDPIKAESMLSDLTQYLRTSLSRTLPAVTTLAQEADMIRAYLDIQKVRMGERLKFTIDVPEALSQLPFPPMLLQPLVENAVEHGLTPRIDGGTITITASETNGTMKIVIGDTGNGFSMVEHSGVGIANVKERIRLLYGDRGRFTIEENVPHGVRAIIEVPGNDL
jgi:sensor histidine kinase YesM